MNNNNRSALILQLPQLAHNQQGRGPPSKNFYYFVRVKGYMYFLYKGAMGLSFGHDLSELEGAVRDGDTSQ